MSLIKRKKNGWMDNFFRDDDDFFKTWPNRWNVGEMNIPAVNVSETEKEFNLDVAVPGMKKEDFKIEVDKGMLCISAELETENEEKEDDYTRKEFNYKSFKRTFWLPENVNSDLIEAKYKKGILKVMIPKLKVELKEPNKIIKIN